MVGRCTVVRLAGGAQAETDGRTGRKRICCYCYSYLASVGFLFLSGRFRCNLCIMKLFFLVISDNTNK